MNKIWLVERTDNVDYDEYDSFVVIAEDEEKAVELVAAYEFSIPWRKTREIWDSAKVTEVDKGGVILGSFNAG